MVVNTTCVLARYQRNSSRDQAGNEVEEFVDSYEIVYEFDHDPEPVLYHPAKISQHGFVHYINLDRSFIIISDGFQSDILIIYFDIKAMDHRLCLDSALTQTK